MMEKADRLHSENTFMWNIWVAANSLCVENGWLTHGFNSGVSIIVREFEKKNQNEIDKISYLLKL